MRNKPSFWLRCLSLLRWALLIQAPTFALVALSSAAYTLDFLHHSEVATGIVESMQRVASDDGIDTYAPVFRFEVASGQTVTVTSSSSSNPPGFAVNETVAVRYDTRNPYKANIDTFWQTWDLAAAFLIASVAVFILGSALHLYLKRCIAKEPTFKPISSLSEV